MYHKTQVTVSVRVSLASHHSLRLVGGVVKKGLGRAVASNQDSPVSHSAIDPLPLFVCDLSAVPPPRRRALSNSILWISLPTPLLPPPQKHLSLREQASSTNKQPPRLLHHHHHLSALTPHFFVACQTPDRVADNHVESLLTSETLQRDPQPDTQEHVVGTAPADIHLCKR
jgi:hypothetical protein